MTDNKKTCAYCHAILFDDDDVVYCPDCGAAHHRTCWNELQCCANTENHGKETDQSDNENEPESLTVNCHTCGKENSKDAVFCQHCGSPLNGREPQQHFYGRNNFYNPYGNIDEKDTVEGIPVPTLASYIRNNAQKYIPDFKKIQKKRNETKKKLSSCIKWNWSAFLFSYIWLFYRKCYKPAWIVFFISTVPVILRTPIMSLFSKTVYDIIGMPTTQAAVSHMYNDIQQNISAIYASLSESITPALIVMFVISLVLNFAIHIIMGLFGEYIFKNDAVTKIKTIMDSDTIENKHQLIVASGGVNILMVIIALYLMNIISNYLIVFML